MMKKTKNNFFKMDFVKLTFFMYIMLGLLLSTIFKSSFIAFLFPLHISVYGLVEIIASSFLSKYIHLTGSSVNLIANTLILFSSIFVAELINKAKDKWRINSLKKWLWLVAVLYIIALLFAAIITFLVFANA